MSGAHADEKAALGTLAARLFLADPDRPGPGPWASLPEGHQRPYLAMAQAAADYHVRVVSEALLPLVLAAWTSYIDGPGGKTEALRQGKYEGIDQAKSAAIEAIRKPVTLLGGGESDG